MRLDRIITKRSDGFWLWKGFRILLDFSSMEALEIRKLMVEVEFMMAEKVVKADREIDARIFRKFFDIGG